MKVFRIDFFKIVSIILISGILEILLAAQGASKCEDIIVEAVAKYGED
mgnify:CR=1 FL=1